MLKLHCYTQSIRIRYVSIYLDHVGWGGGGGGKLNIYKEYKNMDALLNTLSFSIKCI